MPCCLLANLPGVVPFFSGSYREAPTVKKLSEATLVMLACDSKPAEMSAVPAGFVRAMSATEVVPRVAKV